jgi:Alginate export
MKKSLAIVLVFFTLNTIIAQLPAGINMLRYNDNFAYLAHDTVHKKGHEKLKTHPLSKNALLSIGGDVREQLMHTENQNFGDVPPTFKAVSATQLWHRIMLHGDVKLGKKARIFTQLNSTLRLFNPNPLIEIDENRLGLHQAFVDFQPTGLLNIRVGRQELSYGNNRVLTFREGPNNRFAFDAFVVKWQNPSWRIDALVATPVFQKPKIGDDETFKESISGIYATKTLVDKKLFLDVHTLYFKSNRIKYNLEAGDEKRVSLGTRLFSRNPKFNYEIEVTYQTGRFNALNINALAVAYDVKYLLTQKNKWTVGLAGNYITGDKNRNDTQLNSYNLIYSKPSFGLAAPLGASNIVNVNPYIQCSPLPKLQLLAGVYFLSRQSDQDGIYTPNMMQTRPNRKEVLFNTNARKIGNQYVFEAAYNLNNQWAFYFDTAYLAAGDLPKATGKGLAIGYYSFKTSFKF